jgi:hypothetical protein
MNLKDVKNRVQERNQQVDMVCPNVFDNFPVDSSPLCLRRWGNYKVHKAVNLLRKAIHG